MICDKNVEFEFHILPHTIYLYIDVLYMIPNQIPAFLKLYFNLEKLLLSKSLNKIT